MLLKWKDIISNWINCYFNESDKREERVTLELLLNIISHLRENLSLDESKSSILEAHTVDEFVREKYPDFHFNNGSVEASSEDEIYIVASLLLYFICVNSKDLDIKHAMCSQLSSEDQEIILKFSKCLMECSLVTYKDVQAAITEACGHDSSAIGPSSSRLVSETPPALRSLHGEVRRLQAALDAERFDRNYLQEELARTNLRMEKIANEKEQYKLDIVNLKAKISLCSGHEKDARAGDAAAEGTGKLMKQLEEMEERLVQTQGQLDDAQYERDACQAKINELKQERDKWLSLSQQESARASQLCSELECERRRAVSLSELVAELRQHDRLNRLDYSLLECDDPDASLQSPQHNSSVCSEACANVVEVQLAEERAKIVVYKQQVQTLQDQLNDLSQKTETEKQSLEKIISERENDIFDLKHRINEEIEEKNNMIIYYNDAMSKLNNEINELEQKLRDNNQQSRMLVESKMQEIQTLQEEKLSLLQSITDETNKLENIIKNLKLELDAEKTTRLKMRDDYENLKMKYEKESRLMTELEMALKLERELSNEIRLKYDNEKLNLNDMCSLLKEDQVKAKTQMERQQKEISMLHEEIKTLKSIAEMHKHDLKMKCVIIQEKDEEINNINKHLAELNAAKENNQAELESKITELNELNHKLNRAYDNLREENSRCVNTATELKSELNTVTDSLNKEIKKIQDENANLKTIVEENKNVMTELEKTLKLEREESNEIRLRNDNEILNLNNMCSLLKEDQVKAETQMDEQLNYIARLHEEIKTLKSDTEMHEHDIKKKCVIIQEKDERINNINKYLAELNAANEKNQAELESKITELNELNHKLNRANDKLGEENSRCVEKATELKSELDTVTDSLNKEIQNIQDENANLKTIVEDNKNVMTELEKTLKLEREESNEIRLRNDKEILNLNNMCSLLKEDQVKAESQMDEQRNYIARLHEEIETLKSVTEMHEHDIKKKCDIIQEKDERMNNINKYLAELNAANEKNQAELESKITELNELNHKLNRANDKLGEENSRCVEKATELKSELDTVTDSLNKEIQKIQDENANLKTVVEDNKNVMTELEKTLKLEREESNDIRLRNDNEILNLNNMCSLLKEDQVKAESQMDEQRNYIARLHEEIKTLKSVTEMHEHDLKKKCVIIQEKDERINNINKYLAELNAANEKNQAELESKITELNELNHKLNRANDKLGEENSRCVEKATELKTELDTVTESLNKEIKKIQDENANLKTIVEDNKNVMTELEKTLKLEREESNDIRLRNDNEILNLNNMCSLLKEDQVKAESQMDEQRNYIARLHEEIETLKSVTEMHEHDLKKKCDIIQEKDERLNNINKYLAELNAANEKNQAELESKITELNELNHKLNRANDKLGEENSRCVEKATELKSELDTVTDSLNKEIQKIQDENANLKTIVEDNKNVMTELEKTLKLEREESNDIRLRNDNEILNLNNMCSLLKEDQVKAESQMDEQRNYIARLHEEIKTLKSVTEMHEHDLKKKCDIIQEKDERMNNINKYLAELNAANEKNQAELESKITELNELNHKLNRANDKLGEENSRCVEKATELKSELDTVTDSLNKEIQNIQDENANLKTIVEDNKNVMTEIEKTVNLEREQNNEKRLKNDNEKLNNMYSLLKEDQVKAERQIDEQQKDIAMLHEEIKTLKTNAEMHEFDLKKKCDIIQEKDEQINNINKHLAELNAANEKNQAELESKITELNELNHKLNRANDKLGEENSRCVEKATELKSELDTVTDSLNKEIQNIQDENANLKTIVEDNKNVMTELEKTLKLEREESNEIRLRNDNEILNLNNMCSLLKEDQVKAETQMDEQLNYIARLHEEIKTLKSVTEMHEHDLKKKCDIIQEKDERMNNINKYLAELNAANEKNQAELESKITELNELNHKLNRANDKLGEENSRCVEKATELKSELDTVTDSLNKEIQKIQDENANLKTIVEDNKNVMTEIEKTVNLEREQNNEKRLKNDNEKLNNMYSLLKEDQVKAERQIDEQQKDIAMLHEEIKTLKTNAEMHEFDLKKKCDIIQEKDEQINNINKHLAELNAAKEKNQAELESKITELNELKHKLNKANHLDIQKALRSEEWVKAIGQKDIFAVAVSEKTGSHKNSCHIEKEYREFHHQVDSSTSDLTHSSMESIKTISDLEKIIHDKNRTITTLQSDITYLKSLVADSENKLLDVNKELELSKENCQQLSGQLKKIVFQKNEEIADLKKQVSKMSVTENRASQIIKVSAKYQAIILKRIAEIKSNTVLKELTNFGNSANGDNELRRNLSAGTVTMEDLENFLETTDKHLKRCSEKQIALQKERDRLTEVNRINESEIINLKKFLTELSVSFRTFSTVKELYAQKFSRVVSVQRTVRREILSLDGHITDATMCKLERGYAAVMQDLSECVMNMERWVERCIGRTISPEKIKQAFTNDEDRASFVSTTFQNTGLEVQLEELENSFQKLLEEVVRAQKGEGARDAQSVTVMEVRAEYEDKLNRMKAKMKQLYQEQISVYKEKQRSEVLSLERELIKTRERLAESSKAYEEHIRALTAELWSVGEKFLTKKDEVDWLRKKQRSGSLMSLQHVHSSGLVPPPEEPSRPSDTHSLRSLPVHNNTNASKRDKEGRGMHMSDEEGEVFDNRWLKELASTPRAPAQRLSELRWRNSLCPPHLKSSYPAETQFQPALDEHDIKFSLGNTSSLSSARPQRKEVGITAYKKPGPPTPSKNAGRLSATDSELRESLRVEAEPQPSRKTSTPSRLRSLFRSNKNDTAEGTPRSRRLSIFRKK